MTTECKEYFSKSLFLVGEIGGNDYNYAFFKGKTLDDAKTYVPTVAAAVTDATEVRSPNLSLSIVYSISSLRFALNNLGRYSAHDNRG